MTDVIGAGGGPGMAVGRPVASRAARTAARIDGLGQHALVGLAFSMPISTALANVFLALTVLCWLLGGQYRSKLRTMVGNPIMLPALLLFAWLALSLAWAEGPASDQGEFLRKYGDLVLIGAFLWFTLDPRVRTRALGAFAAAMLLTLVLSYAAAAGLLPDMRWLRATPGNAVVFKLHITHGILMALAALLFGLYARSATRPALCVAWAIASGLAVFNVLFMVQGRSGYLMLAALLVLVLIARWRWRGGLAALLVVLAGSAVVYQASAPLRMRVDLALSEYRQWDRQVPARIESSVGLRLEFIDVSLSLVRERPWLGYGVGSFPWAYREKVAGSGRVATANPHNEMLLLAVQGGLPAVALFLFLMTRLLACATRLPTTRERLLAAALTIWLFIGGLPNALLIDHTESLVFAVLSAVLFAGATSAGATPDGGRRSGSDPGLATPAATP